MTPPGFIKIHRSMLEWEWYQDDRCVRLLLHLHLKANYSPGRWKGRDVEPGQMVTSSIQLSAQLAWSRSAVIRTLEKLKQCGEVVTTSDNKWTLITLIKWDKFQSVPEKPDSKRASNRTANERATGQQTSEQPDTIEEEQEVKKGKKKKNLAPSAQEALLIVWPRWAGENTLAKWEQFKAYRAEQHRFKYKSATSEQAAINLLNKWFSNGRACTEALDEAMARGWMFPVDPGSRAHVPHSNGATVQTTLPAAEGWLEPKKA